MEKEILVYLYFALLLFITIIWCIFSIHFYRKYKDEIKPSFVEEGKLILGLIILVMMIKEDPVFLFSIFPLFLLYKDKIKSLFISSASFKICQTLLSLVPFVIVLKNDLVSLLRDKIKPSFIEKGKLILLSMSLMPLVIILKDKPVSFLFNLLLGLALFIFIIVLIFSVYFYWKYEDKIKFLFISISKLIFLMYLVWV